MTTGTVIETMVERIVDLLVVMEDVTDKRRAAVEMRRALSDLPVSKDIIVTTPEEIARRGHLVGTVLRAALRDGKVIYGGTERGICKSTAKLA